MLSEDVSSWPGKESGKGTQPEGGRLLASRFGCLE